MATIDNTYDYFLVVFYYSVGVISIFFSVFLVMIFIFNKNSRSSAFEMTCYLSISLIFSNMSYLIYYLRIKENISDITDFFCNSQATLMTFGEMSQFIWTTIISITIYNNIVDFNIGFKKDSEEYKILKRKRRIISILFGFGFPLLIAILFNFLNVYGKSYHWCWLANEVYYKDQDIAKPNFVSIKFISIFYYSIIWILMLINFCWIVSTIRYLRKLEEEEFEYNKYSKSLIQFPLIQILIVFPQTICKFLLALGYSGTIFPSISVCFMMVQGILFTLSYGFNNQVKDYFKEFICLIFCCKKKSKNELLDKLNERDTLGNLNVKNFTLKTKVNIEDEQKCNTIEREEKNMIEKCIRNDKDGISDFSDYYSEKKSDENGNSIDTLKIKNTLDIDKKEQTHIDLLDNTEDDKFYYRNSNDSIYSKKYNEDMVRREMS